MRGGREGGGVDGAERGGAGGEQGGGSGGSAGGGQGAGAGGSFAYLHLGTGLGAGLVFGGGVHRGARTGAGEFGAPGRPTGRATLHVWRPRPHRGPVPRCRRPRRPRGGGQGAGRGRREPRRAARHRPGPAGWPYRRRRARGLRPRRRRRPRRPRPARGRTRRRRDRCGSRPAGRAGSRRAPPSCCSRRCSGAATPDGARPASRCRAGPRAGRAPVRACAAAQRPTAHASPLSMNRGGGDASPVWSAR